MQPGTPFAVLFCALTLPALPGQLPALPHPTVADAVAEPTAKAPRGKLLEWKSAQGKSYWYRLPEQIDAKHPPDLLVMLHPSGPSHVWSFWQYPIIGDFRPRDIVVSPEAMMQIRVNTFNFVRGVRDTEQIEGLIADFKKRFPVGRVYLYGYGQGGCFACWFAGEHPELVDGIVVHAANVVDLEPSKPGRPKVAVGILHGRNDVLVPVDCAERTERFYREQGYENVKLTIVEGLGQESGHGPLPVQVAQMLDWLDQVATRSAAWSVRIAAGELAKRTPDLGVVVDQVGKARKLLAKADDADKKALPAQIDALGAFLDKAAAAHADRLLQEPALGDAKAPYGPWVAHFLLADRAFGELPAWRNLMGKARELAAHDDQQVAKAFADLEKWTKGSIVGAVKTCEEAFRSARAGDLRRRLEGVPPAADGLAKLARAFAERDRAAAEAALVMAAVSAPLIEELKAAMPALFAGGTK